MLSRSNEEIFVWVALVFGVLPGFFLAIMAIGILGHGISHLDVGSMVFGGSALFGYVGGLVAIFAGREFRTRYNTLIVIAVSVGTLVLITQVPSVLYPVIHQGPSWPAVLVFSTLACAVGVFFRQLRLFPVPNSDHRNS